MSVPRRTNGSDPQFKTEESLVAESIFAPGTQLQDVVAFLRREKVSGILRCDVNKGGLTTIRFEQSQGVIVEESR